MFIVTWVLEDGESRSLMVSGFNDQGVAVEEYTKQVANQRCIFAVVTTGMGAIHNSYVRPNISGARDG